MKIILATEDNIELFCDILRQVAGCYNPFRTSLRNFYEYAGFKMVELGSCSGGMVII